MKSRLALALLLLLCSKPFLSLAQDTPDQFTLPSTKVASKYIDAVSDKSEKVSGEIDKQTEKYLSKLQKQEAKLQRKLAKIDSIAAHNIFANSAAKYEQLQNDVKSKAEK